MELKIKFLKWSTGLLGAMLNKKTAEKLGIHATNRISLKTISRHPKEVFTFVNTLDGLVKENEILVSEETKEWLGLENGQIVDVNLALNPESLFYIKKKLNKKELSQKEINKIMEDIVNNSLSEAEIALFISAMYENGASFKETVFLINSILNSGNKLNLRSKIIADKHSVGGIPGNRTTPLVVSICAAAGLIMPKSSSRAITSAAGTADTIETLAKVEFSLDELKKIVQKTGACMVWGGSLGIVPADEKLIRVEKMLGIDPKSQLLASIMSKKLAFGSTHILIDIPYGKGAKVSKQKALGLKKEFEKLGRHFHKKIMVVLTDGSQPIGNGIGPGLEINDVLSIFNQEPQRPIDLETKSIFLAGKLLELTKKAKSGKGIKMAREILLSGKAYSKFLEIIKAQQGKVGNVKVSKIKHSILANKTGTVSEIGNKKINELAKVAGAPGNKGSGVYLHAHVSERVKKGHPVLTIYAESKNRLKDAVNFCKKVNPIKIK